MNSAPSRSLRLATNLDLTDEAMATDGNLIDHTVGASGSYSTTMSTDPRLALVGIASKSTRVTAEMSLELSMHQVFQCASIIPCRISNGYACR